MDLQVNEAVVKTLRRQRRKNPKYCDYETDELLLAGNLEEATNQQREEEEEEEEAPPPLNKRRGRTPRNHRAPSEGDGGEKPTARGRGRGGRGRGGRGRGGRGRGGRGGRGRAERREEGGGEDVVQQVNGTPKPKRKYVKKKQQVKEEEEEEEEKNDAPGEEEEEESGGRRRRGAARAALKYLHILAREVLSPAEESSSQKNPKHLKKERETSTGRPGRKRKRRDSDASDDQDFVPDGEEDDAEEEEEDEGGGGGGGEDSDLDSDFRVRGRSSTAFHLDNTSYPQPSNGLGRGIMKPVWDSAEITRKYREQYLSSSVFPLWIPSSSDWTLVPQSEAEAFLPQEPRSAAFRVSREGLKEATPLQTLGRFEALPPHPERWDSVLYAGGPVWALEWSPAPDGAPANQHLALACHRHMDQHHHSNQTHCSPGLIQLWGLGPLEYNSRPSSPPSLLYCVALDDGFVWTMKFCPAGCWEPPDRRREPPLLPRLGLLAVASSSGVVAVYSLPQPDALRSHAAPLHPGSEGEAPPVYKVRPVVRLKLGSVRAPRLDLSGLVLSLDWLPQKPHNVMAAGFYDGTVGLWDLSTSSALLRVQESHQPITLLPYRSFRAHDQSVRALSFCPASSFLLATAGEDRLVKTWDLRRLCDPVTVQKRHLTNELHWPLNAPGLLVAQELSYVSRGTQGVHYSDHSGRSILAIPRSATMWSISYSAWLHSVVASDTLGELILAVLPHIDHNHPYLKRSAERRFPVCVASLLPRDPTEGRDGGMGGEEDGGMGGEEDGGMGGEEDGGMRERSESPAVCFPSYGDAARTLIINYQDNDMRSFAGSEKRAMWKRMKNTESKQKLNLDMIPLAGIHKVCFSPNFLSHPWLASAGQSGLVRLHCLRALISPHIQDRITETRNQYSHQNQDPDPDPDPGPDPGSGSGPGPETAPGLELEPELGLEPESL